MHPCVEILPTDHNFSGGGTWQAYISYMCSLLGFESTRGHVGGVLSQVGIKSNCFSAVTAARLACQGLCRYLAGVPGCQMLAVSAWEFELVG